MSDAVAGALAPARVVRVRSVGVGSAARVLGCMYAVVSVATRLPIVLASAGLGSSWEDVGWSMAWLAAWGVGLGLLGAFAGALAAVAFNAGAMLLGPLEIESR